MTKMEYTKLLKDTFVVKEVFRKGLNLRKGDTIVLWENWRSGKGLWDVIPAQSDFVRTTVLTENKLKLKVHGLGSSPCIMHDLYTSSLVVLFTY